MAPVHREGVESWETYLPAGADWVHLWSGRRFGGGAVVTVPAAIGEPPVFWRDGSASAALFDRIRTEWAR